MPIANTYDIGDAVDLEYLYINASGALVNPFAITAVAINPHGTPVALTPTQTATGSYQAQVQLTESGRWLSRWTATGPVNDTETISLMVRPNAPVRSDAAYATIDDVIRLTQGRTFTASSKPAIGDVQDFLALTSAELDGILRRTGYSIPVATGATSALAVLANYNAQGALCLVEQSAPTASRQKDACKLWEQIKKALIAGDIELDAPKDPANSAPRSNAANQATPMFTTRPAFTGGYDW